MPEQIPTPSPRPDSPSPSIQSSVPLSTQAETQNHLLQALVDNVGQIGDRLQLLEERVAGTEELNPSIDFFNINQQNAMVNSIVTTTLPIDTHVKNDIKAKILEKKYVDFINLLPGRPQPPETLALSLDPSSGQTTIVASPIKKRGGELSLQDWSRAWNIFQAILISGLGSLNLVLGMAKHAKEVYDLAAANCDWRSYDTNFRQLIESGEVSWGQVHLELLNLARSKLTPTPTTHSNRPIPQGYCIAFHRIGSCSRLNCQYLHKCFSCQGPHSFLRCTLYSFRPPGPPFAPKHRLPDSPFVPQIPPKPLHLNPNISGRTHLKPPVSPISEGRTELQECVGLPTPIKVDILSLHLCKYDKILSAKLVSGFRHGFDLGFRGHASCNLNTSNLTSAKSHPEVITKSISEEIAAGRVMGPFLRPPFDIFQVNPIGVVPKKTPGTFRFITNLSSPASQSINDNIHDIFAEVSFSTIEDAIRHIIAVGPGAFLAKSDIESAFRLIPIHPNQYHLLVFKWNDSFFFDRCLPMGARSSCQIFELFSSALQHIINQAGVPHSLHYLDDFLFINSSAHNCSIDLNKFLEICKEINVPISTKKTVFPTQCITFLGFEINTLLETIKIPEDKILRAKNEIISLLEKSKCTLKELQSLLGLLQFTCKVIVPGSAFLGQLYRLTIGCTRPFHRIRLSSNAKQDLRIWLLFLQSFNGVTLYREQLFLSPSVQKIFTDASKTLGLGAVFGNKWFSIPWPSQWWTQQNITLLELVPIVQALEIWGPLLRNKCVQLNTDNQALTHVINTQSSKETLVRILVRKLVLLALKFNVLVRAVHLPGKLNSLSDALSRLQVAQFHLLHPSADSYQTITPPLPERLP